MLEVVDISGMALPEDDRCCKALEDLFQNHLSIREFHANQCGLGKSSLLASLTKSFSTNSKLKLLALTNNEFSNCSKQALLSFFAAICSLPQLNEVGLSYNWLLPKHAELFCSAWKKSDHSKFSILSWRFAPLSSNMEIRTQLPEIDPKDEELNRAMLHDTCRKLLL